MTRDAIASRAGAALELNYPGLSKDKRIARAFKIDPESGQPQSVPDRSQPLKFECGGGCPPRLVFLKQPGVRHSELLCCAMNP